MYDKVIVYNFIEKNCCYQLCWVRLKCWERAVKGYGVELSLISTSVSTPFPCGRLTAETGDGQFAWCRPIPSIYRAQRFERQWYEVRRAFTYQLPSFLVGAFSDEPSGDWEAKGSVWACQPVTVTSQSKHFPLFHGISVCPPGHLQ